MPGVPKLVREDEAHFAEGERRAKQRVPEDDVPRRSEPAGERVRLLRHLADVLHVHRRAADMLASLERVDGFAELQLVDSVCSDRREVAAEEGEGADDRGEGGRACDPPPVAELSGESHHDHDRHEPENGLGQDLRPRREDPRDVVVRCKAVPGVPPLREEAERQPNEPERDEHDHPDDHAGADGTEPDRARQPRRAAGQYEERDDRRGDLRHPEDVREALVLRRTCELNRCEVAVLIEAADADARRHARPPEQVGRGEPGSAENQYRCQPPDAHRGHLRRSR